MLIFLSCLSPSCCLRLDTLEGNLAVCFFLQFSFQLPCFKARISFWLFCFYYIPKYPPMVEARMTPNMAKHIMIIIFFCNFGNREYITRGVPEEAKRRNKCVRLYMREREREKRERERKDRLALWSNFFFVVVLLHIFALQISKICFLKEKNQHYSNWKSLITTKLFHQVQ